MTAIISTGAASAKANDTWSNLNWPKLEAIVLRLQMRIAKAEREGRRGKVRALQRLLTCSFAAKCLAVKRVTSSSGSKTPGVDGKTWTTNYQKDKAIVSLKRRGYQPQPLRRIYIPKKLGSNERRPLSIPTIMDRAQQGLHLLSIAPLVEEWADPNAYGFRLKRSAQDAIQQCFIALSKTTSATMILEGDIRKCFDTIDHNWLLKNIPMDKIILKKFLKSGVMENKKFYPTEKGCPQGGIISPALTVMALSGLEKKILPASRHQKEREKINVIAYADDFIVTAQSMEILEQRIKPILEAALKTVGLELSNTKTKVTSIYDGFDFLGFNIRKYKDGKLLIMPSKASIKRFLKEIKTVIKKCIALPTDKIIHTLNSRLTGWVNYYRSFVSSKVFSMIDYQIYISLMKWACKRHRRKGKQWIVRHYFTTVGHNNWRFFCSVKDKNGKKKPIYLRLASNTKIRRHIKVKKDATPFNPLYKDYFKQREDRRKRRHTIANCEQSAGLRIIQPY